MGQFQIYLEIISKCDYLLEWGVDFLISSPSFSWEAYLVMLLAGSKWNAVLFVSLCLQIQFHCSDMDCQSFLDIQLNVYLNTKVVL